MDVDNTAAAEAAVCITGAQWSVTAHVDVMLTASRRG